MKTTVKKPSKKAAKRVSREDVLELPAVRSRVLGVNVYRGFAKLGDLARISRADIYDQAANPKGTQRDLSPAHARDAYEYVKNRDFGFWPEVFLCARKKDVVEFDPISDEHPELGVLRVDASATKSKSIAISRVDGNHRLHYGDGEQKGYSKIEKVVSFCMAFGLDQEEEIQLFRDINNNQKRMNTSHLDGIDVRLTPEEDVKRRTPELYIATRLGGDVRSPLQGRIFDGGVKPVGVEIPLRGLRTGIEYLLSRSTQLPKLEDAEAQYRVIRNYFDAVKKWQPNAWSKSKEYIILRGAGLWAICFIGAHVIDLALLEAKHSTEEMLRILKSGKEWDWSNKGDFKGLSGRSGALEISLKVTRKFETSDRISTKNLFDQIMAD